VQGRCGCARMAWLAVKAHFVHLSHHDKPYTARSCKLRPGESESMDSFLDGVEKLRDEYASMASSSMSPPGHARARQVPCAVGVSLSLEQASGLSAGTTAAASLG